MTGDLAVALVACAITFLSAVVSAVWVVSQIRSTTETLRTTIEHLSASILDIKQWLGQVTTKQNHHGERLARLEAKSDYSEEEE